MDISDKREQEIAVVGKMIELYCRGHKHSKDGLCEECQELLSYAKKRVEHCPHMEDKTFCSTCPTHCYSKKMRDKIKEVMRYAGPRLIFYHPVLTVRHGINTIRNKRDSAA
ncbi:nitrous oxide-stimulated promoter family protein [Konateibacter massiliensis]|uniref:nitrous oxide-stimulated promoter family protein n=1 Tax=Konateibacter massiliensis TaxID=2002841 RepID=UPI000C149E1E|nr:nitrous oxide-stimulated promoter family protein [Konateibacter massiliensis]